MKNEEEDKKAESPQTLFGYPIVFSDGIIPELKDGDIVFGDFSRYMRFRIVPKNEDDED